MKSFTSYKSISVMVCDIDIEFQSVYRKCSYNSFGLFQEATSLYVSSHVMTESKTDLKQSLNF